MTNPKENLEQVVEEEFQPEKQSLLAKLSDKFHKIPKTAKVDTFSNISYSTVVGAIIDASSGLSLYGVLAARTTSLGTNALTAAPYGWWTEKVYQATRTNEDAGFLRKRLIDLLAFNTFQLPVYAAVVAVGSFVSNLFHGELKVDGEKIKNGVEYLVIASPFIGPTLGWYMNKCRQFFDVKTTAEGAYKQD